jgi:hypothetical protein
VKGLKKDSLRNVHWKQAGVAMLISDKGDVKSKFVRRVKVGHLI